jgi:hypothetical protein
MSEMIKRVAAALTAAFEAQGRVFNDNEVDWLAEAAIEAMREPTEAMLMAPGEPYGGNVPREDGLAARRTAWQAMIDEALKPAS